MVSRITAYSGVHDNFMTQDVPPISSRITLMYNRGLQRINFIKIYSTNTKYFTIGFCNFLIMSYFYWLGYIIIIINMASLDLQFFWLVFLISFVVQLVMIAWFRMIVCDLKTKLTVFSFFLSQPTSCMINLPSLSLFQTQKLNAVIPKKLRLLIIWKVYDF